MWRSHPQTESTNLIHKLGFKQRDFFWKKFANCPINIFFFVNWTKMRKKENNDEDFWRNKIWILTVKNQ